MNTISSILKFIAYFEPLGSIKMFAGSSAPDKWLFCDGSAVSRTTYADLFSVIGTTYGSGDGSTTFNLPDFRGRVPIGVGTGTATDATAHALGSAGGAETHTLTTSEMPSHTHTQNAHSHHLPAEVFRYIATSANVQSGSSYRIYSQDNSVYTDNATATNQNTGGDGAHNNMQPYTTVNYIIFAGV